MPNSESEDFESADEGIVKPHDDERKSNESNRKISSEVNESSHAAKLSLTTDRSNTTGLSPRRTQQSSSSSSADTNPITMPVHLETTEIHLLSNEPVKATMAKPLNPESLGAKPKMPQKCKSKSYLKHKSHRDADVADMASSAINQSNHQTSRHKIKCSQSKLGEKISPPSILPSEIEVPENNKFKAKPKLTWGVTNSNSSTNTENEDLHDSIRPLLDKLSSLDVAEVGDEVIDTSTDKTQYSWGLWGSWGMSTLMSGASTVSSHVAQSLNTMSSVIESGLGVVDPEEMARISVETSKPSISKDLDSEKDNSGITLDEASSSFNVMGNVLKFVESTGEMIVSSGLNTLESIGKKTMDVLQEGDPGLKKKRALFSREPNKPTLSQMLKEAQNRAEIEDRERAQAKKISQAHFETLFDDFKGMIHLEALEMLSNTCQLKLEAKLLALSGTPLVEFQRKLIQVKEQCDLPDDEDEEEDEDRGSIEILERDLTVAMRGLLVPVSHTKLIRVSEDTDTWLATMSCIQDEDSQNENDDWVDEEDVSEEIDPQKALREIHQQAIRALARFTAAVAEHFHKTAELLILKEEHNIEVECRSIVMMTSVLCSRVSSVAARFSELLSASANMLDSAQVDHNDVNLLITNVFLEASNSSSYIQDASLLLIPVLQLGAVQ